MASKKFYSASFRWVPVTIIFTLRLVCFLVPNIVVWQCADSSAAVLDRIGVGAPLKPHQKLLEIRKRLRAINKPAVKTIQSPDGDIIDCILRHKQLAFDNPLLRNHTIQEFARVPSGFRPSSTTNKTLKDPFQIWHLTGVRCPKGTIPVRRISAEDLMRHDSHRLRNQKKFHRKSPIVEKPAQDRQDRFREYATIAVQGKYHGASMIASIWNPAITTVEDMSLAQMWITSGDDGREIIDLNAIEVGWQRDEYKTTGCYNLLCAGFVQTSNDVVPGSAIYTISVYDGEQIEMEFYSWKDPPTGNWWLHLENYGAIGYFPAAIFGTLANYAEEIEWGGEIVYYSPTRKHTKVQMGSGHFAGEGFQRASYVRNVQVVDSRDHVVGAENDIIRETARHCYSVSTIPAPGTQAWYGYFYFGGPGRGRRCP